ncbi:MAG: hypothetical protein HOL56_07455 [Flavobacteriales bacterium]|jgi:hypothetical protein|nr:hypothetical protein [Flavobacteriales bacterium]
MNKEVSLQQIVSDIIMFIERNKKIIISFTLTGMIILVLFQKLKPAYYKTSAIVTSGISAYERIPEDEDILNQRTAINLINNLQLDVEKEDYLSLANKLNFSDNLKDARFLAKQIKSIEAEPLLRQDKDEKFHNTPKFQINLLVRDANIIKNIQDGLLYYFNSNPYIIKFKDQYSASNAEVIQFIDDEIRLLRELRVDNKSNINMNTFSILSDKENMEIQNPIIDLVHKKQEVKTQDLFEPLDFVKDFTTTKVAEREVLVWGTTIGILSFFLSIIIAVFREVKQKSLKKQNK